ncbi:MAG: ABC transporter substrate-binding protein [Gammaproteobacteria bacterium]|nr:ABC transporter substrate-binding protein [Gammaproteobacteria bacterium]
MNRCYFFVVLFFLVSCAKQAPIDEIADETPNHQSSEPIKIGDIATYSEHIEFTRPTKQGWKLALEETNANGGVLGRPVEVISRDARGNPGDAVTAMRELIDREQIELFMGGFLSHVGLAVSEVAKKEQVLYLATWVGTEKLLWEAGHDYVFRIQTPSYFLGQVLAESAADIPGKRWSTVAPNYEAGHAFVDGFKIALDQRNNNIEWVSSHWPTLDKIDAGATVQALKADSPEAIYVHLYGSDLSAFMREGRVRGLFDNIDVVNLTLGFRENWSGLDSEMPVGWLTTGYPSDSIDSSEHRAFVDHYRARWHEAPTAGSLFGYTALSTLVQAIDHAGRVEPDAVRIALLNHKFSNPVENFRFRNVDQQATLGFWVGRSGVHDGKPAFVDAKYKTGDQYYPSDEYILSLRTKVSK